MKVLDWFVHGSHQYEFFKLGYDFTLVHINDSKIPEWDSRNRKFPKNVRFTSFNEIKSENFDVVIMRTPVLYSKYDKFAKSGSKIIAVQQTIPMINNGKLDLKIPQKYVNNVVWNCSSSMLKYSKLIPWAKHTYIVHGFDPDEFKFLNLERNNRAISVLNIFKQRSGILGFDNWQFVRDNFDSLDLYGSGNDGVLGYSGELNYFNDLINAYNSYGVMLNPTIDSAMPRSRGEAAMCGLPIVTTSYHDSLLYFKHNKNAIITDNKHDMLNGIKYVLNNKSFANDLSFEVRDMAISHFHINNYLDKWRYIINER